MQQSKGWEWEVGTLKCEICIGGMQLEQMSEFEYLGCVLDELGTNEAVL